MKHLKYLLFFSILCSLVVFTNCGEDSEDPVAYGTTNTTDDRTDDDSTTVLDTDGDGVADADDNCADSPEGDTVDESGCPIQCVAEFNPTTVEIGNQVWTSSNVDVTTYCDGTIIPQVTLLYNGTTGEYGKEWSELTTGAWTYARDCDCGAFYTFSTEEEESFGKLYNWYAIAGIHDNDESTPNKQFAPEGWRVPTVEDFDTLFMNNTAPALRDTGSTGYTKDGKVYNPVDGYGKWFNFAANYTPGTNESGFSAIPAGLLSGRPPGNSPWGNMGYAAYFWTSSVENRNGPSHNYDAISEAQISSIGNSEFDKLVTFLEYGISEGATDFNRHKRMGYSVRLVKDIE